MALIVRLATVLVLPFGADIIYTHLHRNSARRQPLHRRFAPSALMLGNIVTGRSVLAPAGRLIELSSGLDVAVRGPRDLDVRGPAGSRGFPAQPGSTRSLHCLTSTGEYESEAI